MSTMQQPPQPAYSGGSLVWWNVPDTIPIPRSAWQYPDLHLTPEPLSLALRRALDRLTPPKGVRTLIRPLRRDTWAVVFESPAASDLHYSVELLMKLSDANITYLSASGSTYWFNTGLLENLYVEERDRIVSGAVAQVVLDTVRYRCKGVVARKTGGIYFVPDQFRYLLQPVSDMLSQLGGMLYDFAIADTPKTKDNLLQLVVEDLKQTADAVKVHLDARHKDDGIVAAKAALDRLDFYAAALGMAADKADSLRGQLNDLLISALKGDK